MRRTDADERRHIRRCMEAPTLNHLFDQPYAVERFVGVTTPPKLSPREIQRIKEKHMRAYVDIYEQAYDEAYTEVSRTTDPADEYFDALLLAACAAAGCQIKHLAFSQTKHASHLDPWSLCPWILPHLVSFAAQIPPCRLRVLPTVLLSEQACDVLPPPAV